MNRTYLFPTIPPGFISIFGAFILVFCLAGPAVQGAPLPADADTIEEIDDIEEVDTAAVGGFSTGTAVLILGIVNIALLLFQLGTGLRWIKVKFGVHKKAGILLLICALTHGMLALFF